MKTDKSIAWQRVDASSLELKGMKVLIKTNIRDNFFGKDTLKSRVAEWLIGLMTSSPEAYAKRIAPLLVSSDLEAHSGAMFNQKAFAILPTPELTDRSHVEAFLAASEALVSRASRHA